MSENSVRNRQMAIICSAHSEWTWKVLRTRQYYKAFLRETLRHEFPHEMQTRPSPRTSRHLFGRLFMFVPFRCRVYVNFGLLSSTKQDHYDWMGIGYPLGNFVRRCLQHRLCFCERCCGSKIPWRWVLGRNANRYSGRMRIIERRALSFANRCWCVSWPFSSLVCWFSLFVKGRLGCFFWLGHNTIQQGGECKRIFINRLNNKPLQ